MHRTDAEGNDSGTRIRLVTEQRDIELRRAPADRFGRGGGTTMVHNGGDLGEHVCWFTAPMVIAMRSRNAQFGDQRGLG
ncbi:hypothetical protein [Kribbella sp. NPDC048915]|uniref:hypothetical protein n=1 Tax=Kribbella sp. NPDC048915 TaxID=3155148 RepID=UPI0033E6B01F